VPNLVANWLNERGRELSDRGKRAEAQKFYHWASYADPRWSIPWYNRGLQSKYLGKWEESLRCNQKAVLLDPSDQDAWWNLGIAATALRNWAEAARAWRSYGIELLQDANGEVTTPPAIACVRLDADGSGEVVWGERIDPARIVIVNVPLAESHHRFRDIVLNDGASNGTREWNGKTFPVFDELQIWQRSQFSTFRVSLNISSESAEARLLELSREPKIGLENWGTVRIICAECSRGNPGPHDCKASDESSYKSFAFAALSERDLRSLLDMWASEVEDAGYDSIEVALAGEP
jgi:tetratricopeptide (TPR) repeat protein